MVGAHNQLKRALSHRNPAYSCLSIEVGNQYAECENNKGLQEMRSDFSVLSNSEGLDDAFIILFILVSVYCTIVLSTQTSRLGTSPCQSFFVAVVS